MKLLLSLILLFNSIFFINGDETCMLTQSAPVNVNNIKSLYILLMYFS